jgi:hypothetical protein
VKRSPLKRTTALKQGAARLARHPACPSCHTTLRNISAKRKKQLPLRDRVRQEVLARDRDCQAARLVPGIRCGGPLDTHEVKPRSTGGDWLNPDHAIAICRLHHGWVGDHPTEAARLGLHRWSWEQ